MELVLNVSEIINKALCDIAEFDDRSFFVAQGVTDPNAVFGTLKGLKDIVSSHRLIEMPVAEANGVGSAIGAAINGLRPVVSLHRVEFLLPAIEQVVNNAAKANFISGGQYSAPILIRAIIGRGWGQGPSHSQGFESFFASIPGLKVVCPSIPSTAYNMIVESFYDDAPTVCLEHRWVHYAEGKFDENSKKRQKIKPVIVSGGSHMTIVTYGHMTFECLLVVNELKKHDINVELIDLQMLRPLSLEKIFDSVRKTGRVVVVDQGMKTLGIAAEVACQVIENCYSDLETPPLRLGLPNIPSPSSASLAKEFYVSSLQILDACISVLPPFAGSNHIRSKVEAIHQKTIADVPNAKFKGPF